MKLMKLTNALEDLDGELLFINPNVVSAIYEYPDDDDVPVTTIYGPTGEQWRVKETLSDTTKMFEDCINHGR
jgi:hypothetical protein